MDQATRPALAGFRMVTRTFSGTRSRANRGPAQISLETRPDGAGGHFVRINLNLGLSKPVIHQTAEPAPAPAAEQK